MNLTKEAKFAILCRKMAAVDGSISDAEKAKVVALANANGLDVSAVIDAWNGESDDPHDLMPVIKSVTDEEERDLMFFAVGRMAAADNILAAKEIARLFTLAESWDWAPSYVAIKVVQLVRKFPELKLEGED